MNFTMKEERKWYKLPHLTCSLVCFSEREPWRPMCPLCQAELTHRAYRTWGLCWKHTNKIDQAVESFPRIVFQRCTASVGGGGGCAGISLVMCKFSENYKWKSFRQFVKIGVLQKIRQQTEFRAVVNNHSICLSMLRVASAKVQDQMLPR